MDEITVISHCYFYTGDYYLHILTSAKVYDGIMLGKSYLSPVRLFGAPEPLEHNDPFYLPPIIYSENLRFSNELC